MVFIKQKVLKYIFLCLAIGQAAMNPVSAANDWSLGISPQVLLMQYDDSTLRDNLRSFGLFATADYLDKGGLKLGYNFATVNGRANNPDVDESVWFLSGRYVHFSDTLTGKLGFRLDGYAVTDKTKIKSLSDESGMGHNQGGSVIETLTDDIGVIYAQLDYMNYAEQLYADIGYASSDYNYEQSAEFVSAQDNQVQQFTATGGFAFNNRYDWLQARLYFINLEHGNNTDGVNQSNAVEFKWLHWFKPNALLNIHSSFVKLLAGKRLFPVDPDSYTTYSIADMQTGSAAAGLEWKIGAQSKFFLLIGYDKFENLVIDDKYSATYVFGSVSLNW
ncbi:MAG: hypothetical protein AMJ53_09660 [Gammaproteobacteria bacterium SG8_11]|nr:MAG: hypothetical protein AMJ53_09660 [Gammaproteobacteria bacterium SG8_11]